MSENRKMDTFNLNVIPETLFELSHRKTFRTSQFFSKPETIHVTSETWEAGKGLKKRVHVASVAEVREADSERILLERTP